jgi:hypothetical protein
MAWKNVRGGTERFPPNEERNRATMTKPSDLVSPINTGKQGLPQDPYDFSVVLGGPLFQLLRRAYLYGDALELLRRRMLILLLLAWLPLLVLSMWEGQALGGSATVPFLWDVEMHVRFLLTVPLLISAELVVHMRMRLAVEQFLARSDSGGGAGSVRGRGGFSAPVAQLALGRGLPHRAGVRRRCPHRLARPCGAANSHLVCGTYRRAVEALAGRVLVWLCQPAAVPIPTAAVVLSAVHLGAISLVGLAH